MKTHPYLRRVGLFAAFSLLLSPFAHVARSASSSTPSPSAVSSLTVSGTNTFLSGSTVGFAAGSTVSVSGIFGGTPTGGTLNLSNLTLTLGSPVVTGTLGVTGAATVGGLLKVTGDASMVTGALQTYTASSAANDWSSGFMRLWSTGANNTTNGKFQFRSVRSDGTNALVPIETDVSGNVILIGNMEAGSLRLGTFSTTLASDDRASVGWMSDAHPLNVDGTNGGLLLASRTNSAAEVVVATANSIRARFSATGLNLAGTLTAMSGIKGTTTNDNAAAGNVGEYVASIVGSGSAVSLSNGAPTNVTSIVLTTGDWDVSCVTGYVVGAGTVTTYAVQSLSTISATLGAEEGMTNFAGALGRTTTPSFANAPYRLSLASTTTVYLVAYAGFSVNTLKAFGILRARRVR